jgi:3-oxoadipate enol-lactonase
MPKIQVGDIEIYYERQGEGEPLVLIAGFSVDHVTWQTVVPLLSKSYEVITFDNRGAGQTTVPEGPYSIEQLADDAAGLCQALGIEQAKFVGNSMGGFIVQMLAHRHPELVQSLVIENSVAQCKGPFMLNLEAQLEMIKVGVPIPALLKSAFSWSFSERFISQPGVVDALLQMAVNNPYPFTLTGFEGQKAALESFDAIPWLGELQLPVLVVGSDQDIIFPERTIKALAKAIPQAQYHRFESCGHNPHIEYPEEFARVVCGHFASHRGMQT